MIPAAKMNEVKTSSHTRESNKTGLISNRELKYFKRPKAQPEKPIPIFDERIGKILLRGKDMTPKPLENPQLANFSDIKDIILEKMEVEILPPASDIIPVQEILASKDLVQYRPKEVITPPEGSAVYQFLQNKKHKKEEKKELQLRKDITLDKLANDEEDVIKKNYTKVEESQMLPIDDSALQKQHEYEDLPNNKILIQLQQSKTLCLLEIKSLLPNITGKCKNMTICKSEEYSPDEQLAIFDEKQIIETFNEKETQTIRPRKIDGDMLSIKTHVQEVGVMATNSTFYDDIKEYKDREEKKLMDEINKQKKKLNELLMDPLGPFRTDLISILYFLKSSYAEMASLNPKLQLSQIQEFIKDFQENYNEKERESANKFAVQWETRSAEKEQIFIEKEVPEEELEAIKELKELSSSLEQLLKINPEDEYEKITKNKKFILALQAVEDILIYEKELPAIQTYFNEEDITGKAAQKELSIAYNLKFLWEFSDEDIKSQAVNCIAWNENNSALIAAGYGKWQYSNYLSHYNPGYICIWPLVLPKNKPMWKHTFNSSVVSICFHPYSMFCLAIGLCNGDITIVDINEQIMKASRVLNLESAKLYGPAYALSWFRGKVDEGNQENMYVITGGKKGALYQWKSSKEYLISEKILSLPPIYGKIQGIVPLEPEHKLPCHFTNTSVMCITKYVKSPSEKIHINEDKIFYLVATDDGCIHQCSLDYYHHHLDYFRAHNGPINSLAVNNFSDCVFLTCGEDFSVCIWALGVHNPLITLSHGMECVVCAVWSKSHPTILASISGTTLYIWDIQRKTRDPVTKFNNPNNHQLTSVSFSSVGENILIGDIDGNLLVYHIEDLPIIPHFPEKVLVCAIKHALVYNKNLLKELENTGPPFEEEV